MKRLIEQAYSRVKVPPVYKVDLLNKLLSLDDITVEEQNTIFWKKPGFLALLTSVATTIVIIYGIWLPANIEI